MRRLATLMPREAATDWHVSPLRIVYIAPVHVVGVGVVPEVVVLLDVSVIVVVWVVLTM